MAQDTFDFNSMFRGDPTAKLMEANKAPGYARTGVAAKWSTGEKILASIPMVGLGMYIQDNRRARKAYEKQVAATDEAVAEQQKRELATATNQKKSLARVRGIELMYKTGMFDAPKWPS